MYRKCRRTPARSRRVALRAIRRELRQGVIRVRRRVVVGRVTARARVRGIRVVAVQVALIAIRTRVYPV